MATSSVISASNLQLLLNAIPRAEEGHIITAEHYNALRLAVLTIADQIGVSVGGGSATLTLSPAFLQNEEGPNWFQSGGAATMPMDGNANGWLGVQLPDGARIQSMTVIGQRTGQMATFRVKLMRQTMADGIPVPLIDMALKDAANPMNVTASVNVPGAGPAALEEYKTVDTGQYTYFVTARLLGAENTAVVQISAIQISYSRV